jgi:hypothetical protein
VIPICNPADPLTTITSALHAQQAISQIQDERKLRRRYVTDIQTGELLDVVTEGYYDLGLNEITPDGRIETASFIRLLKRALKSTIQAHPERKDALAPDLKLLTTPKSAREALASPQWREWRTAIDKELASLIQKGVYEVRKIPHSVKAIPTKLVLRIKLKSDGTVFGVLPTDKRFFCLPPPGFEETAGYGWYMLKGLYTTARSKGGHSGLRHFATGCAASNYNSSRLETSACVMFFVSVTMERQSILTTFADSLSSPMKSSSFCA